MLNLKTLAVLMIVICFSRNCFADNLPKMPIVPDTIHVRYQYDQEDFPLPEKVRNYFIRRSQAKLNQVRGNGNAARDTREAIKGNIKRMEEKSRTPVFSHGKAEYWGSKDGQIFKGPDDNPMLYYKDKYVMEAGSPASFSSSSPKDTRHTKWLHIFDENKANIDFAVPYLGFEQPALKWHNPEKINVASTKNGSIETWLERKWSNKYVLAFDSMGRLSSLDCYFMAANGKTYLTDHYDFANYKQISASFSIPTSITRLRRICGIIDGEFMDWDSAKMRYTLEYYDTKHLDDRYFSGQYPRVGMRVYDYRKEFNTKKVPTGLEYEYLDGSKSIDESSRYASNPNGIIPKTEQATSMPYMPFLPALLIPVIYMLYRRRQRVQR